MLRDKMTMAYARPKACIAGCMDWKPYQELKLALLTQGQEMNQSPCIKGRSKASVTDIHWQSGHNAEHVWRADLEKERGVGGGVITGKYRGLLALRMGLRVLVLKQGLGGRVREREAGQRRLEIGR